MRVVIQHLTGSKANQIEQFAFESIDELTFGRDPTCAITFDPQRDDAVSRRHATIKLTKGERPSFVIADVGSSNGTIVNGNRISAETELLPGDTIQLGLTGPSFVFDLQPRPAHLVARTRVISDRPTATTRIDHSAGATSTAATIIPPASTVRAGVGRETVQRMLSEERQVTSRRWMYALGGVVIIIAAAGGTLMYRMNVAKQQAEAEIERRAHEVETASAAALAEQKRLITAEATKQNDDLKKQMGMSPSQIVEQFGNATVLIDMKWRLFDRDTGKALFQKTWPLPPDGKRVPAYIQTAEGVVRWLTTEDQGHQNIDVGGNGSGSGFVINEQGYILTNKHVAAGWQINYNTYSRNDIGRVVLFQQQPGRQDPRKVSFQALDTTFHSGLFLKAVSWTPSEGGVIFDADQPFRVGNSTCACEGRNERLEVRFPHSRTGILADLVRFSGDADVALIKIQSPEPLTPVPLAPDDSAIVGGAVTVLGYPGDSVKTYASSATVEGGEIHSHIENVPEPTVTPGVISRLGSPMERHGGVTVIGQLGEVYQLTAATGAGNSGGPVFDANGKVIGLFTYGSGTRETITYAVPIHYGRDLMQVQRKF